MGEVDSLSSGETSSSESIEQGDADDDDDDGEAETSEASGDATFDPGKFDLVVPDLFDHGDERCQNIDYLFAIDNSASMADEHAHLGESIPACIAAIRGVVELAGAWGVSGSVCADDYGPIFEEAIAKIDSACDMVVPKR
jgi:hypothetical protein